MQMPFGRCVSSRLFEVWGRHFGSDCFSRCGISLPPVKYTARFRLHITRFGAVHRPTIPAHSRCDAFPRVKQTKQNCTFPVVCDSEHMDQLREQAREAERSVQELQATSEAATAALATQRDNYEGVGGRARRVWQGC